MFDPEALTEGEIGTPIAAPETCSVSNAQKSQITPSEELFIMQQIADKLHHQLHLPAVTFESLEKQAAFYKEHKIHILCFYEITYRTMTWAALTSTTSVVLASQMICLSTDADSLIGQAAYTGELLRPMEVVYAYDPLPILSTMGQGVALWIDTIQAQEQSQAQWRLLVEYVLKPAISGQARPANEDHSGKS